MVRFLSQVPRAWLVGAVFLAVALWGGAVLWRGGKTETPPRAFSGIRQEVTGVEYVEEDPRNGTVLSIRAARSVTRDGAVGKLFRTPLRPVVTLEGVRIELRDAEGRTLTARAGRGRLDPRSWKVRLTSPSDLRLDGRTLAAAELIVGRDGEVAFPRGLRVEGEKVQRRAFEGPLAALKTAVEKGPATRAGATGHTPVPDRLTPSGRPGRLPRQPETGGP